MVQRSRRGAGALLHTVISALSVAAVRRAFASGSERDLRTMVRARRVEVSEGASSKEVDPSVMSFVVPAVALSPSARIDVLFDPGRTLDGWTCHLLEAAHARGGAPAGDSAGVRDARLGSLACAATGRAPLMVGAGDSSGAGTDSSGCAATDFTVLIEGASRPQTAPQFH